MPQRDNIFLIGFSGTGKTSVGRRVARRLGWTLVDMDSRLEGRADKPVARIFAEDGEAAFREMESKLLEEICLGTRQVVSTGGGVVVDPRNRDLMLAKGVVIRLDASSETVYRRLGAGARPKTIRPLLSGRDPLERIQALKAAREEYYAIAQGNVATDGLTIEQAARRVLQVFRELTSVPSGEVE